MSMRGRQDRENARARRKWTDEEDELLLDQVRRFGVDGWRAISAQMSERDPKQCRERYLNHLDPAIKKDKLSLREWHTMLMAHDSHGNKWSEIAQHLPGRTANTLKNFWHSTLRPSAIEEIFGLEAYNSGLRVPKVQIDDGNSAADAIVSRNRAAYSSLKELTSETSKMHINLNKDKPAKRSRSPSLDRMEIDGENDEDTLSTNPSNTAVSSPRSGDHSSFNTSNLAPSVLSAAASSLLEFDKSERISSTAAKFHLNPVEESPSDQMVFEVSATSDSLPNSPSNSNPTLFGKRSLSSSGPLPRLWDALVETAMDEYHQEVNAPLPTHFMSHSHPSQPQQYFLMPIVNPGVGMFPNAPNQSFNTFRQPPNPESSKQFPFWSH